MTGPSVGSIGGKDAVRVSKRVVDSVTVVSLAGELDARTAAHVHPQLLGALPPGAPALIDLSEVAYMSSAGLRAMLIMYRQAQRTRTSIALVGVSATLRGVLSATGFLRFFEVADSIPEGILVLRRTKQSTTDDLA